MSQPNRFSVQRWKELSASGIFQIFSEKGIGKDGVRAAVGQFREIGRTNDDRGLTFSAVTQLASTIYCLRAFAASDTQSRYLPAAEDGTSIGGHAITESKAGSDVMNMSTTATLEGECYCLTGTKRFITNGPIASTLIVYAKTVENGIDRGLSAFLIQTDWFGVHTEKELQTAGLRGSPIGEVHLQQVRVPMTNRIGHVGAGLLILDQVMKREVLFAFAANIGEMEQLVENSVRYSNKRKQFGVSIGSNQLVANRIVETQIAIELGGALIESIAARIDGFEDLTIPVAAAKIFISEANLNATVNAIYVRGSNGYLVSSELPTYLLDAVPGAIYSGSNDLLRTKIATLLGITS